MAAEQSPKNRPLTPHEQAMIAHARANGDLMNQVDASLAARKRGEKGIPGPQVHAEAEERRRRAGL